MANTKVTMLDALVTQLGNAPNIAKSTCVLSTPADARKNTPYIGLITGPEEVVVEDATHIRYELEVNIILLKRGRDIEEMLDIVKNALYTDSLATTIGAFQIKIVGQEEVALVDADMYSSTRIMSVITYVATKGAF